MLSPALFHKHLVKPKSSRFASYGVPHDLSLQREIRLPECVPTFQKGASLAESACSQ